MSSAEERFHEEWLGMVQPVDGLVVSIPVLVEAQCLSRQPPELQRRLADDHCRAGADDSIYLHDLSGFLTDILGWKPEQMLAGDALPTDLQLYVPEGGQVIKPTLALRAAEGASPLLLLWDLGTDLIDLPLDKPETRTGPWEYPAAAKFDRLLRHTRVPIGVLTNRTVLRLVYAPHGESSGSITFRIADLLQVGGRPILDALVMLLGATRLFGVAPEHQLPAILAESRKRQANVTNELADQVFDALQILLRGFEAAAERDGRAVLDAAYLREGDHLYGGLLTHLLRLVFVLYAEDRGLLPVESELYAEHLSVLGLFEELQADHGAHPDSMSRRFGAYGRLTALFRAIYLGVQHGDLVMPARRGQLFSPQEYPFLEGWDAESGSAPIVDPAARAATRLPSIDDETIFRVLEKLLILRRQRLSYRALDVEQIGSVYEALMGYHVVRLEAEAVCLKPSRVWLTAEEVLAEKPATRTRWLQEATGMAKGQADKLNKALAGAKKPAAALDVMADFAYAAAGRRPAGALVIQPGPERRRTSSHYTPRSLTEPIVRKTLEPLFRAMGDNPPSERILNLKVCDPAMGSGAFLVEACRYLADQVVLAWTREGRHDLLAGKEDATLIARRLVAQRCLYGVDKNPYAVNLAKLSLWLVTLARDLPFTFVDHALRHGDSLVGLSFDQITAFHWKPGKQLELCKNELEATLNEAIGARQRILDLAGDASDAAQKEKEWLLKDAEDALDRVRLLGDLVVGAFFSAEKDKEREKERTRRLDLVLEWLRSGGPPPDDLVELRAEIRKRIPVFHWMAEYPEVFWVNRPDPLDADRTGHHAWIDAFVGNPPFTAGLAVSGLLGTGYRDWLLDTHSGAHGNADLSAHFFRRVASLIGDHGTCGMLATNTISQGDTRETGLAWLRHHSHVIYDATTRIPWSGGPNIAISVVHFAKGSAVPPERVLDGQYVSHINSQLRGSRERETPAKLRSNSGCCFMGTTVSGKGFLLTPSEAEALLARDSRFPLRPFLNGEDVNTSPSHAHERYVIDVSGWSEEKISSLPELRKLLEKRVLPERMGRGRVRGPWWNFERPRAELYRSLTGLRRCLVTSAVSKYLVFVWKPVDIIFSHALFVFPISASSFFAVLQSRVFDSWMRLLSSTLEDRAATARVRFTAECFETFGFPCSNPQTEVPSLSGIAERLYEMRAALMSTNQQGLTQLYNALKARASHEPGLEALRDLHLDLDRAVLTAYGWSDLVPLVPPYTIPQTDAERQALSAFEDAVIDRLFALNAERAELERLAGASSAPTPAGGKPGRGRAKGKRAKAAAAQLSFDTQED